MYCSVALVVNWSFTCRLPLSKPDAFWKKLLGMMPSTLSEPNERRALARSVPPVTATVVDEVCPVLKNDFTLSGYETHGDAAFGLVNWRHGAFWSYVCVLGAKVQPYDRPSVRGPKLWSRSSCTPPP